MRLTCPNCGAQYEVDDSLVPDGGRDVQCSNCGHAWYQKPAHQDRDLAEDLDTVEDLDPVEDTDLADDPDTGLPPGSPPGDDGDSGQPVAAAPRPAMDESIRGILTEEAERETRARRAEAAGVETQGDFGLDAEQKSSAARERMARLRGLDVDGRADSAAAAVAAATAAGSRRDLLPDIEEINSSLRSAEERNGDAARLASPEPRRRRGFRLGFGLVFAVVAAGLLVYLFAGAIGRAVPSLAPALDSYVAWADRMRDWLDASAQGWLRRLSAMLQSSGDTPPAE